MDFRSQVSMAPSLDRMGSIVWTDNACTLFPVNPQAGGELMQPLPWPQKTAIEIPDKDRDRSAKRFRNRTSKARRLLI